MAPWLQQVSNFSGKRIYVYMTHGKIFVLNHGESESVDDYITGDAYTKIDRDVGDEQGYLLKYHDYNIALNDTLGKNNDVPDTDIHTWGSEEYINIEIYEEEMRILCNSRDLGIYQSDGEPVYYSSVSVYHVSGGGIQVTGFSSVAADRLKISDVEKNEDKDEVKEEEEEAASAKMKVSNADDSPTKSIN